MPYGLRTRKRVKYEYDNEETEEKKEEEDNSDSDFNTEDKESDDSSSEHGSSYQESSNNESSDNESSDHETSDSDKVKSRTKRVSGTEVVKKLKEAQKSELSDYEKIREQNIKEKMDLLNSLNLPVRRSPQKRHFKRTYLSSPTMSTRSSSPQKSSYRLRKSTDDKKLLENGLQNARPNVKPLVSYVNKSSRNEEASEKPRHPAGPLGMRKAYDGSEESYENVIQTLHKACEKQYEVNRSYVDIMTDRLSDKFKQMTLVPEHVVQIVKERLFTIAVHPNPTMKIVSGGGKFGEVSVWNVETNELHSFEPHVRPVSCLEYNQWFPQQLISSSYDGTVRCTDLNNEVFIDLYRMTDENYRSWISFYDFASSHSIILALGTGKIALVDTRDKPEKNKEFQVLDKALKTVSVHPIKKEYFVVSSNDGIASIYDVRKLDKNPATVATLKHEKMVNSASFSPCTGNYIITTSMDNFLRIFDGESLSGESRLLKSIRHDNQVGRWLTTFRATWLPEREDSFIVGSMLFPRQIQLYSNPQAEVLHVFSSSHMKDICSVNVFHPSLSFLASGSSNGNVFVFM